MIQLQEISPTPIDIQEGWTNSFVQGLFSGDLNLLVDPLMLALYTGRDGNMPSLSKSLTDWQPGHKHELAASGYEPGGKHVDGDISIRSGLIQSSLYTVNLILPPVIWHGIPTTAPIVGGLLWVKKGDRNPTVALLNFGVPQYPKVKGDTTEFEVRFPQDQQLGLFGLAA